MSQQTLPESAMPAFATDACVGDSIEWEKAGFLFHARLEYDSLTSPADFWTLDSDEVEDRQLYEAWLNDEWHYMALIVSVSAVIGKDETVCLDSCAAALWGIEYHHSADSAYLNHLVTTLEPEALIRAETVCGALMSRHKRLAPSSAFGRWLARLKQSLNRNRYSSSVPA